MVESIHHSEAGCACCGGAAHNHTTQTRPDQTRAAHSTLELNVQSSTAFYIWEFHIPTCPQAHAKGRQTVKTGANLSAGLVCIMPCMPCMLGILQVTTCQRLCRVTHSQRGKVLNLSRDKSNSND